MAGTLPFLFVFLFVVFALIYKFINKLKIKWDVILYLLLAIILPVIPVLISISNTSRRFALAYILMILVGILFVSSFNKLKRYFSLM